MAGATEDAVVSVLALKEKLKSANNAIELIEYLDALQKMEGMSRDVLRETKIGVAINALRKHDVVAVAAKAKTIVTGWKSLVEKPQTKAATDSTKRKAEKESVDTNKKQKSRKELWRRKFGSEATELVAPASFSISDFITGVAIRDTIRKKLAAALGDLFERELDQQYCASQIEESMMDMYKDTTGEYKAKYRDLLFNLKDSRNEELNAKLCFGLLKPQDVPKLSNKDLASSKMRHDIESELQDATDASRSDWAKEKMAGTTDMFRCGKCGKRECTYYQMQTRGADEPMTVFVTCMVCENRWKM